MKWETKFMELQFEINIKSCKGKNVGTVFSVLMNEKRNDVGIKQPRF